MKNECPLKHLEKFSELCDLMPVCTDSPDYVKMHLFQSSLAGDAKDWYKCLESDSLITWGEVKKAYQERFYPSVRTQDWRKKIASFTQDQEESLAGAWN